MVEPGNTGRSTPRSGAKGGLADQSKAIGSKAASDAAGVVDDLQDRASSLSGKVSDKLATAADDQKNTAASKLEDLATTVHRAGEQFEGHQDVVAKLIERGADELGGLARTLRSNDLNSLMSQLQTLAKRQPALFVGVAVLAGFSAVRFVKVAASCGTSGDLAHLPE